MQPDYFAILRTLYEFRIAKQVGAKANSLLMALAWKANVLHFPDSLAVWNSEVRDTAGLTDEELVTARNRLTQALVNGQFLVRYESGGTRGPGRYQLNYIGLMTFFSNTPNITPENPVNVPGNLPSNVSGNVGGNVQGNVSGNPGGISLTYERKEINETNERVIPRTRQKRKSTQVNPDKVEYAEYVHLTPKEYTKLAAEFGENGAARLIEILNNYKGANGKKYDSDYLAIRNWVVERYREEQAKMIPDKSQNHQFHEKEDKHIYVSPTVLEKLRKGDMVDNGSQARTG